MTPTVTRLAFLRRVARVHAAVQSTPALRACVARMWVHSELDEAIFDAATEELLERGMSDA